MNKILCILALSSILFSQSSSIGIKGFGETIESLDAASASLGGSKFFSGNSHAISFSSTSSYWKSSLTKLYISIQSSSSDFNNNDLKENHFQMFSFMFPIGTDKAFAFGINPIYRSEMKIIEEDLNYIGADVSPSGNPLAYRTTYDFSGGMSEFFAALSVRLTKSLSLGVRWSKIFGNSYDRYVLSLSDVSFDEEGNISFDESTYSNFGHYKKKYSSNSYGLEFRYKLKNYEFVSSILKTNSLNIELKPEYDLIGEIDGINYIINPGMKRIGIGIKYNLKENLGLISEIHTLDTYKSHEFLNILRVNSPSINSKHLGLFYQHNSKNNKNKLSQINFRLGIFSKKYKYNLYNINDLGITLGLGFEYLENKNILDFSIIAGSRTSEYPSIEYENYYKFIFSISSGEKWFDRERND